jgi:hypothetical protein
LFFFFSEKFDNNIEIFFNFHRIFIISLGFKEINYIDILFGILLETLFFFFSENKVIIYGGKCVKFIKINNCLNEE